MGTPLERRAQGHVADPHLAALLEILTEIRGLRADLIRDRRPRRELSRADRDRLSHLLPAIAATKGSEEFVVSELAGHAPLRLVVDRLQLTTVQVGQLFDRATGVPVAGYVVERRQFELHRRLWRVVKTV